MAAGTDKDTGIIVDLKQLVREACTEEVARISKGINDCSSLLNGARPSEYLALLGSIILFSHDLHEVATKAAENVRL